MEIGDHGFDHPELVAWQDEQVSRAGKFPHRLALVNAPLRARFGVVYRLDYFDLEAVQEVARRAARLLAVKADPGRIEEIASRARGTPRVSLRLLRRVRDYAQVKARQRYVVLFARSCWPRIGEHALLIWLVAEKESEES